MPRRRNLITPPAATTGWLATFILMLSASIGLAPTPLSQYAVTLSWFGLVILTIFIFLQVGRIDEE